MGTLGQILMNYGSVLQFVTLGKKFDNHFTTNVE